MLPNRQKVVSLQHKTIEMNTESILQTLGLTALSEMQRNAVELVRGNHNAVLLAPTGSGKTLAFLLPLAESINSNSNEVQAVILSPTRELAMQTLTVLTAMKTGIRAMCCYGGRPAMNEHRKMAALRPQIIIGTPGRLNDHIDKGNFNALTVKTLVVDEYDKMFELKFQDEVESLLGKLPCRQRCVLVSATDMEEIPHFVAFRHHPPAVLNWLDGDHGSVAGGISHFAVHSEQKDKLDTLDHLLRQIGGGQTVVFVNYREAVERIGERLRKEGHSISLFHGGLEQDEREAALALFRSGSANVLVSTELSARGIDVPTLQNVVHYHLPASYEAYIHRCGRTGRWEATGRSFIIVGPEEKVPAYDGVDFADYALQPPFPAPPHAEWTTLYIGRGKKDKLGKGDIVGFLCKTGRLKAADIGMIDVRERYAHVAVRSTVAKQVLRNVAGEKIKKMATRIEPLSTRRRTR